MIGRPEYTLTLPPPCPTNRDHLTLAATPTDGRKPRTHRCGRNGERVSYPQGRPPFFPFCGPESFTPAGLSWFT